MPRPIALVVLGAALITSGCASTNAVAPSGVSATSQTAPAATSSASSRASVSTTPTVSATGSGPATTTPASRSASAVASPSVSVPSVSLTRPAAPTTPPAAAGYTYGKPATAVAKAFAAQQIDQGLSAPLVKSVSYKGSSIGSVGVRQLAAEQVGDPEIEQSLVAGVVKGLDGLGYTVRNRTVAGASIVVALRQDSTIATWYADGLLVQFVTTEPESTALAYAKAELTT